MGTQRVTDDLDRLLELLPDAVQEQLRPQEAREQLLEVVLDLGRVPEARYPGRALALGSTPLSRQDLTAVVARLGQFGGDVVGLTCRVGRAVFGTVAMVRDLLDGGQSLLLMGRPGVGKTTALREIARVLADELERRVVVIDTSNEIAGDGDIPHPAIGRARRMQVARPELQHQTMIEAVENHMPEVIVIDEIGTELEAQAARTIAERGVVLVATAHGNALANLIKNPTLSDLVGGIQAVTLGDEEARRRRSQKTVLERAAEPTFPVAVEMHSRQRWAVHTDVAATVDQLLRGLKPRVQERELTPEGGVLRPPSHRSFADQPVSAPVPMPAASAQVASAAEEPPPQETSSEHLQVLCCGVPPRVVEEAIRSHGWKARVVEDLSEADVVLSVRLGLSRQPSLRRQVRNLGIPILVIKSDTLPQVTRAMARLLRRQATETAAEVTPPDRASQDDELAALEECRLAVEQVVMPQGRPVELLPRSERVLRMQADLVRRYRLRSDVFGEAEMSRLRVFPR